MFNPYLIFILFHNGNVCRPGAKRGRRYNERFQNTSSGNYFSLFLNASKYSNSQKREPTDSTKINRPGHNIRMY